MLVLSYFPVLVHGTGAGIIGRLDIVGSLLFHLQSDRQDRSGERIVEQQVTKIEQESELSIHSSM